MLKRIIFALMLAALGIMLAVGAVENARAGDKPPAPAPAPKITVEQALSLAAALRNLDGRVVPGKDGAPALMVPWEFGCPKEGCAPGEVDRSGKLRLRIANDLSIADAAVKAAETARQGVLRETLKKAGKPKLDPGTQEANDYQAAYADILAQPAAGTQDLARIKASELKLDRNEIGGSVLSALGPILDDDLK